MLLSRPLEIESGCKGLRRFALPAGELPTIIQAGMGRRHPRRERGARFKRGALYGAQQARSFASSKRVREMSAGEFKVRVIFVQIKCRPGSAYDVAARIADTIENASEIYSTSGSFDLLAKFRLDDDVDPGLFVTSMLQRIEGVVDTYTIIGFNAFTPAQNPS